MKRDSDLSRRDFLRAGLVAGLAGGAAARLAASVARESIEPAQRGMPVIIASGNGLRASERAMAMIKAGADTLDAVVAGVNIVEEDPSDMSVGYGGLPNERGDVELDSCVMHGPTYNAGAVASLRGIKTPSSVAKLVMERTDHILLVGPGALAFAKAHGFEEVDLLTDNARRAWLRWKERLSKSDDWLDDEEIGAEAERPTGTINCCALNEKGELSGVTTTSGLAYKIPGRVGDSPIIGAGLYVDNDVGAFGPTGRGEAAIMSCGSRIVVENMHRGMKPEDAALELLQRICAKTTEKRLLSSPGKPNFNLNFYAVNKDGEYGAAAIYRGGTYVVHDGTTNTRKQSAYIYEGR
ncbi:MAG: N(4)-(beta-N-acetylglucosaminyl)-L-asparaginase [Armatimonadetes bacterium]|nr:N(4)-(beta-N-acetylglucosaminyl)-L-asparaginase [Armatimonadota bacterium]